MGMMLASGRNTTITPVADPFAVSADGGPVAAQAFTSEDVFPGNAVDPEPGAVFFALSSTEQAYLDLSQLDPSTAYRLTLAVTAFMPGGIVQFAVLDGVTPVAAESVLGFDPFALQFTTPADTSALRLQVAGDGTQLSVSGFQIARA